MVDAIATILTGVGASIMTEARDDEEWRKRVTAKLRQIPALLLIDNIHRKLDSSALAAALTAPFWEDRILGVSEMARLPIRCIWVATGNNPAFSNEMARRLVRIRLDARVDQPWLREGFRHPDLIVWIRHNRARLVTACLVLCRAWIAAGRPVGVRTIGSYESWSQVMGGVLEVARIDGFLGNLADMMEASDSEGSTWRVLVTLWWVRFGSADVTTADLFTLTGDCEPPLPLGSGNEKSQRIRLGKALGKIRDRVFDTSGQKLRIRACGVSHQAARWQLVVEPGRAQAGQITPDRPSGECWGEKGNVEFEHSPDQPIENKGPGECGECGECFPTPTREGEAVYIIEESETHSPPSPHSPTPANSKDYTGECRGEGSDQGLNIPRQPAWLDGVP
jgi:hypothetical protein